MKKLLGVFVLFLFFASEAQQLAPLVKPEVYDSYVMFRKTVTRRMNLEEKQNRPFYSKNGEISKLIINAVKDGLLTAYESDSCISPMTDERFIESISVEQQVQDFGFGGFGGFGDTQQAENTSPKTSLLEIPGEVFSVLYIREDVVFDRNRSRMYFYIRSVTIALPATAGSEFNPGGFEKPVAHFKYEDLMKLFRGPLAKDAIWYNTRNIAAHINFSDAFELRLFNAPITKVSNAEDLDIRQQYGDLIAQDPKNALIIQQKYEYDLMEYESMLWEY